MQNRIFLLAFLLLLLPASVLSGAAAHDFHVSVMRIDHNPDSQSLEVSLKLFTDDLEMALGTLGAPDVRLGSDREHPESDDFIFKYLNNRLTFLVNGKQMSLSYVGKEVEVDVVWIYFELKGVPRLEALQIRNQLLIEQFDDQSNLVHIHAGGAQKSMLLRKGSEEDRIAF